MMRSNNSAHICVLQCVAVCCSVLHSVAAVLPGCSTAATYVCCIALKYVALRCRVLQSIAECCSVLQCAAVCCSVLQCAAVCCSVLLSVHIVMYYDICIVMHYDQSTQQYVLLCVKVPCNKSQCRSVAVLQCCSVAVCSVAAA